MQHVKRPNNAYHTNMFGTYTRNILAQQPLQAGVTLDESAVHLNVLMNPPLYGMHVPSHDDGIVAFVPEQIQPPADADRDDIWR